MNEHRQNLILLCLFAAMFGALVAMLAPSMQHSCLSDYQEDIEAAQERDDDEALRIAQRQLAILTGEDDDLPPQCVSRDPFRQQPPPKKP